MSDSEELEGNETSGGEPADDTVPTESPSGALEEANTDSVEPNMSESREVEDGQEDQGEKEGDEEAAGEREESEGYMSRIDEEAELLRQELDDIPPMEEGEMFDKLPEGFEEIEFPDSYKENVSKEILVLSFAENFRRQYTHLYPKRKPLFLTPLNEWGVDKLVCSYIQPTNLEHRELYNWDGCAEFVADYLNFVPLEPPIEIPKRLLSPATVLRIQKGTCFEYATLLCSMLLGVGYDAYCVSGYATRETCFMDESRRICPLLERKEVKKAEAKKEVYRKYVLKASKDLKSRFENRMAERKIREEEEARVQAETEAVEREREEDKPPPDPLFGLRVHAWVLVLCGKREVPESFFIEPFTGISHPLDSMNYLGIESLWNHQNVWVNMQDCSEGVRNLRYDLGDCTLWEYMFPGLDKPLLTIPDGDEAMDMEDEDDEKIIEQEKHLELPPSWTLPIVLSRRDFEMRFPLGKKVKLYKRAKLEKFAPYLLKDGMVTKLSTYSDREFRDLLLIREYFFNRADKLQQRVINTVTGWVTEYFARGRTSNLSEHTYQQSAPGPETHRTMLFYDSARVDGLAKREETPTQMTDHFVKRPDFMYYRHVDFGQRIKKFRPAGSHGVDNRPIDKIIVRYHRNSDLPANEDIAEKAFLIAEDRIQLTYQTENSKVAASIRDYIKPPNADDRAAIKMQNDIHSTFQVNPQVKEKKQVEVFQLLLDLLDMEQKEGDAVRSAEWESRQILDDRSNEEAASALDVGLFDTLRNEKAKQHRRALEERIQNERMRRKETELDYLAPFLAQMGLVDPSDRPSREQAFRLREECLNDFKQRLIDKANLIQARFERETGNLQKKQQWYQQNQIQMSKEDEQEYLNYCNEATFRITTLELMLSRHKQTAPHKYMELEKKIRNDQRLADYLY